MSWTSRVLLAGVTVGLALAGEDERPSCADPDASCAPTGAAATSSTHAGATRSFRSGPVASSGVVYLAASEEPGDAGYLFGIDDSTGTTRWEAGARLDAQTGRKVFTVSQDGATLLDFATVNAASVDLQRTLLTPDATSASDLITWWLGKRFGRLTRHRLGALVSSTPAVLSAPSRPSWYFLSSTTVAERAAIDAFISTHAARRELVLVGSRDGALHAFYTPDDGAADPTSGEEAWAYLPYFAARALGAEKQAGLMAAFPDGSPTLADAKLHGAWRTVIVESGGVGSNSLFALDVTDTVPPSGVKGPTPLWRFSDENMGLTTSKPAVVRVKKVTDGVAGEEWLAIFASGKGAAADVGDSVYAVDLADGTLVWRFDLGGPDCRVSSDVVALETRDEPGTAVDGYVDRVLFADNKGRVWKLDPTSHSNGSIESMGPVTIAGLPHRALFSTKATAGALGEERAIAGGLASGPDATGRLALYFGTGGTEDSVDGVQNELYAVQLDTGELRGKLGAEQGVAVGTRFHGGVVYNAGQLLFTESKSRSGAGGSAARTGALIAVDATTLAAQLAIDTPSEIVAPLFVQNGEVYAVTRAGKLMMSAHTGTGTGSRPSGGGGGASSGVNATGTEADPFSILSWVQVL